MSLSLAFSMREQVVADLALPGAEVVAARRPPVASFSPPTTRALAVQMRPLGGSTTRGYSAGASQPSQPPRPVRPRGGHAARRGPTRRGMRPMIVQPMRPAASATTRFWFGIPASGASACASSRLADRLHAHERGVEAALAQRHPGERPAAAGVVLVDHRAPDRGLDVERLGLLPRHLDRLGRALERPRALGREVGLGVPRVGLEQRRGRPSRPRCS